MVATLQFVAESHDVVLISERSMNVIESRRVSTQTGSRSKVQGKITLPTVEDNVRAGLVGERDGA